MRVTAAEVRTPQPDLSLDCTTYPIGGQPKRFSLWEIHPVTSVKVCKKIKISQCDPDRASDWKAF
jgi:hypothetical protein